MISVERSSLEGVLVITPPTIFEDHRGTYVELYNQAAYRDAGIDIDFVQDDISTSRRDVLRGIHGDSETWKLISCLQGSFYLVVVNCDQASSDFSKWEAFVLSDRNNRQVLVPPNHGNRHLVLTESAIFHYKQSTYYNRESQFTFAFDDPRFSIWWPVKDVITSERDRSTKTQP